MRSFKELNDIKARRDYVSCGLTEDCEMCGRPAAGGIKLYGEDRPSYYLCDMCLLLRYGHEVNI